MFKKILIPTDGSSLSDQSANAGSARVWPWRRAASHQAATLPWAW